MVWKESFRRGLSMSPILAAASATTTMSGQHVAVVSKDTSKTRGWSEQCGRSGCFTKNEALLKNESTELTTARTLSTSSSSSPLFPV